MSNGYYATIEAYKEEYGCDHIDTANEENSGAVWGTCVGVGVSLVILTMLSFYIMHRRQKRPIDKRIIAEVKQLCAKSQRKQLVHDDSDFINPEPNLQLALDHLKSSSPVDACGNWRSIWKTRAVDLCEVGGPGIVLYFMLVRNIGFCFFYMTLLVIPTIIFSYAGNFAPDTGNPMIKTTIGNLGVIAVGGYEQELRHVVIGCQAVRLTKLTQAFGWMDFLAVLTFICFVCHFTFRVIPRVQIQNDAEQVTPSDFAVEVDYIPPTIENQTQYESLIKAHFEKLSMKGVFKKGRKLKVCEVSLVRNYDKRLGSLKERAILLHEKQISDYLNETRRVAKLEKKIDKATTKLGSALRPEEELPVVRAHVTFSTTREARAALHHYRFATFWLFRFFQSRTLRFQHCKIRVRRAPEPSNIIWENQDVSWAERKLRKGIVFVIFALILILSLLVIIGTSKEASSQKNSVAGQKVGDEDCDGGSFVDDDAVECNTTAGLSWNLTWATMDLHSDDVLDCFCTSRGYATVMQNEELRTACKDWLIQAATMISVVVGCSFVVVVINYVLRLTFFCLGEWERPPSVSALNSKIMFMIFCAQTANTAIVTFVVHWHSEAFAVDGEYSEFERGWYSVVGAALMTTMILNTVSVSSGYYVFWAQLVCCRSCTRRSVKHQSRLLELYTNPQFDICSRYSQLLMTVYVTMIYNAGLPILNALAVFFCFTTYWADKIILLRGSCRPPAYDVQMPKKASRYLLFAIVFHLCVAIAMYSHPCTFPSNPLHGALADVHSTATSQASGSTGVSMSDGITDRATRESTWMLFALLLVCMVFFVLHILIKVVGATLGEAVGVLRMFCCAKGVKVISEDAAAKLTWDQAKVLIDQVMPPASYKLSENPTYAPLVSFLRDDTESLS